MTPLIVEGVTLHYVPTIHRSDKDAQGGFDCKDCALSERDKRCVRIHPTTGELRFEPLGSTDMGKLFCIHEPNDIVFINDTPEDIARYVAARLEAT